MAYSTTQNIWENLGEDAYTKIRAEVVGTGSGTNFSLEHENVISGSEVIYTGGTAVTSSAYNINLDDGDITFTSSVGAGVVVSADYNYGDMPDSWVSSIIDQADDFLEKKTGLSFESNSSEVEYISVEKGQKEFFTRYFPIITLTSVEQNIASDVSDTPDWSTSEAGLGNDYMTSSRDLNLGRIRFIDNYPLEGIDRLRVTYDWGYTTTPSLIQELSILLATRRMINSAIYRSIIKGRDNFTPTRLDEIDARVNEILMLYRKQSIGKI